MPSQNLKGKEHKQPTSESSVKQHERRKKQKISNESPTPECSTSAWEGERKISKESPTPEYSRYASEGEGKISKESPSPECSTSAWEDKRKISKESPTPECSRYASEGEGKISKESPTPECSMYASEGEGKISKESPTPECSTSAWEGKRKISKESPTPECSRYASEVEGKIYKESPTPECSMYASEGKGKISKESPTPECSMYASEDEPASLLASLLASNEGIARLKEEERKKLNRKKRKDNSGEIMRVRNMKRKLQKVPLISGLLRYYVSNEEEKREFMNKVDKAKLCVKEKISSISNYDILTSALDCFLKHHHNTVTNVSNGQAAMVTANDSGENERMVSFVWNMPRSRVGTGVRTPTEKAHKYRVS